MIYAVGSYLIDKDRFEIRQGGKNVAVEPQVFDLLLLLIENRERVVTKDEIVEKIWKGRCISDSAISSRIKSTRSAVGDDGKLQTLIRTVNRRGFRFVGEVTVAPPQAKPPTLSDMAPQRVTPPGAELEDSGIGIDLSLPEQPSIAVLPFHIVSGDEDSQIISDGVSLDIMTRLARTRWLFVISRGTAFRFRGPSHEARIVSRKLGVRYVLQGSADFTGRRIRVRAALVDAVANCEAWAGKFDCELDDVFRIQEEIANEIVSAVETEIEQSERRRALMANPSNLDAWSAYHRGAWHMYQFTPAGYEEAGRMLRLAANLDPNSARAFAGLSFVHWQRAFLKIGNDREGEIQQAFDYAHHTLLLDPREPQGYWALGRACLLRQDVDQAIEEIGRSIELNPNFAIGHYSLALARLMKSENSESESSVRQARRLSPYDLMSFAMLAVQGVGATLLGRTDEGANLSDRAVRQPNSHYHILAMAAFCNAAAGRDEISKMYLSRLRQAHPGYRIADYFCAFPYRQPDAVQQIRSAFLRLGLED